MAKAKTPPTKTSTHHRVMVWIPPDLAEWMHARKIATRVPIVGQIELLLRAAMDQERTAKLPNRQ